MPADTTWIEVSPGVHTRAVTGDEPTTATVVIGSDAAALINPGRDVATGAHLRSAVADLTDRPLTHVIVTDGSHAGALGAFDDVTSLGAAGLPTPHPTRTFHAAAHVSLGSQWLEVLALGRSDADAIVAIPDAFVVVAGDLIDPRDDATDALTPHDIDTVWPDAVHELLDMLRRPTRTAPGDRVICSRGPVTDAAGVARFGMAIDQRLHADDPEPPRRDGRIQLPLT